MSVATFLLFVFLVTQTISLPFLNSAFADAPDRPNLLSILVSDRIFKGSIETAVVNYARNVEKTNPDIRTLIVPITLTTKPQEIAQIQQKLYYEGDGKTSARLAYTLIVGDVPLPVVKSEEGIGVSVYPYVDFENRKFRFDTKESRFVLDENNTQAIPEIGHGVLRPHTGDSTLDSQGILDYFAKLNDYYKKQGNFSNFVGEEPRVLVVDNVEDVKSFSMDTYRSYRLRQISREDLTYKRHTASWSQEISSILNGNQDLMNGDPDYASILNETLKNTLQNDPSYRNSLKENLAREKGVSASSITNDQISHLNVGDIMSSLTKSIGSIPDIQSVTIIEQSLKQFVELFGSKSVSDRDGFVYRLGRYLGTDDKLLVDTIPTSVTRSDEAANSLIKGANDMLASIIKPYFEDLAVDAPVLVDYVHDQVGDNPSLDTRQNYPQSWFTYNNYFAGQAASHILTAQDCSIFRGSSQTVMASKGFNFGGDNGGDAKILSDETSAVRGLYSCFPNDTKGDPSPETQSYWGNHSILAYDSETQNLTRNGKQPQFRGFTKPVFDIAGSKKINPNTYQYDPSSCLKTDLIRAPSSHTPEYYDDGGRFHGGGWEWGAPEYYPDKTLGERYTCLPSSITTFNSPIRFQDFVLQTAPAAGNCVKGSVVLTKNGSAIYNSSFGQTCDGWGYYDGGKVIMGNCDANDSSNVDASGALIDPRYCYNGWWSGRSYNYYPTHNYKTNFKLISSLIYQNSPTSEELKIIRANGATPNIAVDKDPQFAYLTPSLTTARFIVPNFFRLGIERGDTRDTIDAKIRSYLSVKQKEIDDLRSNNNPDLLDVSSRKVYDTLRDSYPTETPKLVDITTKDANFYHTLISALEWTTRTDVESQYDASFRKLLDGNIKRGSAGDAFDKGLYGKPQEVALIRSEANNGGFSVSFNKADAKAIDLTADDLEVQKNVSRIVTTSQALGSFDIALKNTSNPSAAGSVCGPIDGVDLAEWPAAIQCWIKNEVKVGFTPGVCSARTVGTPTLDDILSSFPSLPDPDIPSISDGSSFRLSSALTDVGYRGKYQIVATHLAADNKIISTPNNELYSVRLMKVVDTKTGKDLYRDGIENLNVEKTYAEYSRDSFVLRNGEASIDFQPKRGDVRYDFVFLRQNGTKLANLSMNVRWAGIDTVSFPTSKRANESIDFSKLTYYGRDGVPSKIHLDVYDRTNGNRIYTGDVNDLSQKLNIDQLKKTGIYLLVMKANDGESAIVEYSVVPSDPVSIQIVTPSDYFIAGSSTPFVLKALDSEGNTAQNADILVELTNAQFKGGKARQDLTIVGPTTLSVIPTNSPETLGIKATLNGKSGIEKVLKNPKDLKITFEIQNNEVLVAGGSSVFGRVVIKDKNNQIATDFSAASTLSSDSLLLSGSTTQITNGITPLVKITSRTKSSSDTQIQIQVLGLSGAYSAVVPVFPDKPMFVALDALDTSGETSRVQVSLRDIYGNVVFGQSSQRVDLTLQSTNISSTNGSKLSYNGLIGSTLSLNETNDQPAIWIVNVTGTIAGTRSLVRAQSSRDLSLNNYIINASDPNLKEVIFGNSKNSLLLSKGAVISPKDIHDLNPSFSYAFLTGDAYADQDGGETMSDAMIFDRESRVLGVTSYSSRGGSQRIGGILSTGKPELSNIGGSSSEITTELSNGYLRYNIIDRTSRRILAQVSLPRKDRTLVACTGDIGSCNFSQADNDILAIAPSAIDVQIGSVQGAIRIVRDDTILMTATVEGKYNLAAGITLRPIFTDGLLRFGVYHGDREVAQMILIHKGVKLETADLITPVSEDALRQSVVVYPGDRSIALGRGYIGAQTSAIPNATITGITIDDLSLTLNSSRPWQDDDLSRPFLQDITGGTRIGDALVGEHSVFLMHLGDPTFSLPLKDRTATYDMSIGEKVYDGANDRIISALKLDLEGDGFDDIVVVHQSGVLRLIKNTNGILRNRGIFARLPQANLKTIRTISSRGKGTHLVFIDDTGHIALYGNVSGRIVPTPLLATKGGTQSRYNMIVHQLDVYDMDQDGRDDIVALDNRGIISILSLHNDSIAFDQTEIDSGMSIKIADGSDITGVAVADNRIVLPAITQGDPISARIRSELYGEVPVITDQNRTLNADIIQNEAQNISNTNIKLPYVRGDRALVEGLEVTKVVSGSGSVLLRDLGELVSLTTVKNLSGVDRQIKVLDRLPKIVTQGDAVYQWRIIPKNGVTPEYQTRGWLPMSVTGFDRITHEITIRPGEKVEIQSTLPLKKIALKSLQVGNMDSDNLGEIAYSTSDVCGSSSVLFDQVSPRVYQKTTLPGSVPVGNGIGFSDDINKVINDVRNISISSTGSVTNLDTSTIDTLQKLREQHTAEDQAEASKGDRNFFTHDKSRNSITLNETISDEEFSEISDQVDDIIDTFACGYGAQGCFNSPFNWAPLMPGSAPRFLGMPIGPLMVQTGVPTFAVPTSFPTPFGPIPFIWPGSPWGAGGAFGDAAPYMSQLRIYTTVTLSGSKGAALCIGGPSSIAGNLNPLYPLFPVGNCIIKAKPLASCSKDGSKGDVRNMGVSTSGGQSSGFYNGGSCKVPNDKDVNELKSQIANNGYTISSTSSSDPKSIPESLLTTGKTKTGPLLSIGDATIGDDSLDISLDLSGIGEFDFHDIVKVKNFRVSGFPDFLMDWVNRQMEEVQTKLTTLPTIYIILPELSFFSDLTPETISKLPDSFRASRQQSLDKSNSHLSSSTRLGSNYTSASNGLKSFENQVQGGLSGIEAAYSFLGSLPFLTIAEEHIPVTYPVIQDRELELAYREWVKFGKDLSNTITEVAKKVPLTPEQLAEKAGKGYDKLSAEEKFIFDSGPFRQSIEANLKAIDAYKRLPQDIQKYLTWKEKYSYEILCNVEQLEKIVGGFIADNGIRFQKWVEMYVLLKAILQSWQVFVDLFKGYEAECSSCTNQRYDLKYFMVKLLSAVIPKIPIFIFPKWPDIILDIHNIRLGVTLAMPVIDLNPQPLTLPRPPKVLWPDLNIGLGSFSLTLPAVPNIIPAPPTLPPLPDIPSLPGVTLPNLPPPPKIPNIMGLAGLGGVLKIFKVVRKMLCILKTNPFVPENKTGERIAQITDRSGILPSLDFLHLDIPNIPMTGTDAIKVTSYVNYNSKVDIIAKFVREKLEPLNAIGLRAVESVNKKTTELNTNQVIDLNKQIPDKVREEIDRINSQINQDVNLNDSGEMKNIQDKVNFIIPIFQSASGELAKLENEVLAQSGVFLDVDTFIAQGRRELPRLIKELDEPTITSKLQTIYAQLDRDIASSRADTRIQDKLLSDNSERFDQIRSYLNASMKEDQKMREQIHTLQTTKDESILSSLSVLQYVSNEKSEREQALSRYQSSSSLKMNSVVGKLFENIGNPAPETAVAAPLVSGDSPQQTPSSYPGLYYRSGDTQRLFTTATEGLTASTRITKFALTNDANRADVVYVNGNSVYVKKSKGVYTSIFAGETAPDVKTISSLFPDGFSSHTTPDYFGESSMKGRSLTIGFDADTTENSLYRLDYGAYHTSLPSTPGRTDNSKGIILIADVNSPVSLSNATGAITARLSIDGSSRGKARITARTSTQLQKDQVFTLSAFKPVFIDRTTRIQVTPLGGGKSTIIPLEGGSSYTADDDITVRILDGQVSLLADIVESREVSNLGDLRGMVLTPDTDIELMETTSRLRITHTFQGSKPDIELDGISRFQLLKSNRGDGHMEVTVKNPPNLTYARISDLTDNRTIQAFPMLISDAKSSRYDPLSTLNYQRNMVLNDATTITFPDDILLPSKATKILDTIGDSGLNSRLSLDPTGQRLLIAAFDTLGTYSTKINLVLEDGFFLPINLSVTVRAPVPSIDTIVYSPAQILGSLDRAKQDIPIDIMRKRGSGIKHLSKGVSILTTSSGAFSYNYSSKRDNTLEISLSGSLIASIDEMSGVVTRKNPSVGISVIDSTSESPATLDVSYRDTPLARLAIRRDPLFESRPIMLMTKGQTVLSGSVGLELLSNKRVDNTTKVILEQLPLSSSYMPGGYILRTKEGEPLFVLSSSLQFARFDSINLSYAIAKQDNHMILTLLDGSKKLLNVHFPDKLYSRLY